MVSPIPSEPSVMDIFTPDQWADRLLRLFPHSWTSDQAKKAGGILHAYFKSSGGQYEFIENGLDWVLKATRIATAKDVALDAIAEDYFGKYGKYDFRLPRQNGEPDESYRKRIYANLLQTGGMRVDIERVVQLLTGESPRIIEPWNVMDTAAFNSFSYFDIDTKANPSRFGDQNLRYQGFVESILPSFSGQGSPPIYGVDAGLAFDRSFFLNPAPTWFMGEKELDRAVNSVRLFGTVVWRKYGSAAKVNYARGMSRFLGSGVNSQSVHLVPPASQALVVLAQANWNSNCYVKTVNRSDFTIHLATSSPGGEAVDWIAAPATLAGFGLLPITEGDTEAALLIQRPGSAKLVTPNWNTTVLLQSVIGNEATFAFNTPAPAGAQLNHGTFDPPYGGLKAVMANDLSAVVFFDQPVELPYQCMLLPSWNTEFTITKTIHGFTVEFVTTPAEDGQFYWGILSQPY